MIRRVAHFALRLIVAVALAVAVSLVVAVVIAALWQLPNGGGFRHKLDVGLFVVGGFAILLGGLGLTGGSPSRRTIGAARVPALPAFMRQPEATGVNTNALLLVTGGVLLAGAFFV